MTDYKIDLPLKRHNARTDKATTPPKIQSDTKKFSIIGQNGECSLTTMEITCLIETLQLKTSKQIGMSLKISPKTVEHHLAKLKMKMGAKSKHELYIIAKNNALV